MIYKTIMHWYCIYYKKNLADNEIHKQVSINRKEI